ncbi:MULTISPECIES: ESX secretion-associated protein EspG [unclassified Nocardia]|uniref:ESX secretion-associated protein EspG n=1 Tax=unclassified Nocardia TaxID=2637762 RepID=UPI001CE3D271|nr:MULTISPECIES: ESX secretion-associated protein EspG [unclassified Nocardia]
MPEWTLETDDFAALWYSAANDRFPRPLNYLSSLTHENDVVAHRTAVRSRYPRDELEEIELALHTLSTSDLRIEILGGTHKYKGSIGEAKEYRIVGARNPYRAVVLSQAVLGERNGPIRVRMFRPESLPTAVVKAVPACEPGKQKSATFHPDDLRPRRDGYLQHSRRSPREQYERLLQRPANGGGAAGLLIGPLHSRPEPVNTVQWYDIIDDGRYVELVDRHVSVRPATPEDLIALFTGWIDRALQRLRDDENARW